MGKLFEYFTFYWLQDVGTLERRIPTWKKKIVTILNEMSAYLSIPQMKKLQEVVLKTFSENELDKKNTSQMKNF